MKHVRILGLALVAIFVMAAIAATGASASSPEWGECVAKAGGKYLDSNCQTKGKGGSFEWLKGSKLPNHKFTGHNVGSGGVLDTSTIECDVNPTKPPNKERVTRKKCEEGGGVVEEDIATAAEIECESETNSGEAVGKNKIANVHVTFKGCLLLGQLPCTGTGLSLGEVQTNTLAGELAYINKATHEVGVRLTPAAKHGRFAEFVCAGSEFNHLEITVGAGNSKEGAAYLPESKGGNDAIISPITPVNTMTSEFTQVYTVNKATTENIPNKLEGKPISLLENYAVNAEGESEMWSRAGEEITNVNTPEIPGEIKG